MTYSRSSRALLLGLPSFLAAFAAVVVLGGAGCKGAPAFICADSGECPGGTCETSGFCSFPDNACGSGSRYGSYAGDGLSDTCVGGGASGADSGPGLDGGGGFFDAPTPAPDARSGGCFDLGGGTCLELPTVAVTVDNALPADFTCPKYVIGTAAAPIAYSGLLEDPITGEGAANGTIQFFRDTALTDLMIEATANALGTYSTTLPTGTTSPAQIRITATGRVETLHWNTGLRLNPATPIVRDWETYSNANLSSIASGAGVTHTPGQDVVYGFTYDCKGELLRDALAVLSSTSSKTGDLPTLIPGTLAVYNGRPRAQRTASDSEGNFFFFRVPAAGAGTKRYAQVWGYISPADIQRGAYGMRLISEVELPSRTGSLISVESSHTEGPLLP